MAKYRILVVDDDPDSLLIGTKILERDYEVVVADNGLDALGRLQLCEPDIVLADVMMPVMNGWDFVERLREFPEYNHTPVIFLSALSQRSDIEKGYSKGADLYLTKPIEPERLLRLIQMQIDENQLQPRPKSSSLEELSAATAAAAHAAEPAPAAADAPILPLPAGGARPRVLIVDDDADLLDLLRLQLSEEYEVVTAKDGLTAMDQALKWKPDLFIIDWMMPKVSGLQMIEILHRTREFQQAPIIFISAKGSRRDRQMVERLAVESFLIKPFDPVQLSNAIREVVERPDFRVRAGRPPLDAAAPRLSRPDYEGGRDAADVDWRD